MTRIDRTKMSPKFSFQIRWRSFNIIVYRDLYFVNFYERYNNTTHCKQN